MLIHPPVQVADRYPLGSIIEAFAPPSDDWMLCDGSVLAQASYPNLYAMMKEPHPYRYQDWESEDVLPSNGITAMAENSSGRIVGLGYSGQYATTTDYGTNWSTGLISVNTNDHRCMACDGTTFVGLGYNTNKGVYSTNGTSWTEVTLPISSYWQGVVWDGSYFVAVPYSGTQAIRSSDGTSWSTTGTLSSSKSWNKMATDGSSRIIVTDTGDDWAYSDNSGATWTTLVSYNGQINNSLDYFDSTWVSGQYSVGSIGTSSNGLDWIYRRHNVGNRHGVYAYHSVGWSNEPIFPEKIIKLKTNLYIMISHSTNYILYSTDFNVWEPLGIHPNDWYDAFYNSTTEYIYIVGYGSSLIKVKTAKHYNTGTHFQLPSANITQETHRDNRKLRYIRVN